MVQAQFVLELLMRLLACPACFNCAYQSPARRTRRVVGKVIVALAAGACFAHQPCGLTQEDAAHAIPSAKRIRTVAKRALSMRFVALLKSRRSHCCHSCDHCAFRPLTTVPDKPLASSPSKTDNASLMSPVEIPLRYNQGKAADTRGDFLT